VQERVLRKVVSQNRIPTQLAQEVAHLGLVPANQFAEGPGILARYRPGDEFSIVNAGRTRFFIDRYDVRRSRVGT
jgi:hypothetical protein